MLIFWKLQGKPVPLQWKQLLQFPWKAQLSGTREHLKTSPSTPVFIFKCIYVFAGEEGNRGKHIRQSWLAGNLNQIVWQLPTTPNWYLESKYQLETNYQIKIWLSTGERLQKRGASMQVRKSGKTLVIVSWPTLVRGQEDAGQIMTTVGPSGHLTESPNRGTTMIPSFQVNMVLL